VQADTTQAVVEVEPWVLPAGADAMYTTRNMTFYDILFLS
jgi:hypothetical protein